jgi:hypothetical protein
MDRNTKTQKTIVWELAPLDAEGEWWRLVDHETQARELALSVRSLRGVLEMVADRVISYGDENSAVIETFGLYRRQFHFFNVTEGQED